MSNEAHEIMWRRMRYMLSPQWDIYMSFRKWFHNYRVLEVGFGTGAGVLQYCNNARIVDAIEPDPGAVDFANKCFPISNVNWILGDITKYDTPKKYNAVVMIETLEHIKDWKRALENICNLLTGKGILIMSARNNNADLRRWKELHEREWSAKELKDSLSYYFPIVNLYDYSLKIEQDERSKLTPLVAICKMRKRVRWMP